MPENSFNLAPVDAAFKTLCRILFGRPVGGLLEFEPYLKEAMIPFMLVKSSVSGKDVFLSNDLYRKDALFISPNEIDAAKSKTKPVSLNDIKDIDSLFRAASESMVYCGNKAFGKNANVGHVDNAIDCIDVYYACSVRNVKKGAYISCARESEYIFGIPAFPKINYSMRCLEGINVNRMFETYYSNYCADMYYSFNCYNCSDVIFGFNLRGKRHVIGNVELPREKYAELKRKLAAEIADELSKNKRAFSISDLARMNAKESHDEEFELIPSTQPPSSVEKAWDSASKIVLGTGRNGILGYAGWLQERALPVRRLQGKFGTHTYQPLLPVVKDLPASALCTRKEAMTENGPLVAEKETALELRKLAALVAAKAAFTMEMTEGETADVPEITQAIDSTECWSSWDATNSTRSACSTGIIQSKYIFGGYFRILDSEFCINCYEVVECRRCFELDSSSRCSGCYFSHNLEGCEDCILCWNLKGKRYAVLNQEVGKEKYLQVKKMLLDYLNGQLDAKRRVDRSVFALSP